MSPLPLPSTKYGGTFFVKLLGIGEQFFLVKFMGGIFYIGTNDQIMQGGKLMVKRFQWSSQVNFPYIDLCLGY